MAKLSLENIRDDLHVAMAMRAETAAGLDAVVVNHAQRAEAHEVRVMKLIEGKRVTGVEPAIIAPTAFFAAAIIGENPEAFELRMAPLSSFANEAISKR